MVSVLLELHQLRVLDMSYEKNANPFEIPHPSRTHIAEFLNSKSCLVHLAVLDISGEQKIETATKLHTVAGCCQQCVSLVLVKCSTYHSSNYVFKLKMSAGTLKLRKIKIMAYCSNKIRNELVCVANNSDEFFML